MMFVPVMYFALSRGWDARRAWTSALSVALGAAAGTLAGLGLLAVQIASVLGNWGEAAAYLAFTFGKRAAGDPAQYTGLIADSLRADAWSVLWTYIAQGRAIDFGNWLGPELAGMRGAFEIQFYELFAVFGAFGLAFLLRSASDRTSPVYHRTRALFHATWFSLLPPLSWLMLFKAHSYIHTNLNYVIWQMPFTLFGFAFCAMTIRYLFPLRSAGRREAAHAG
jgi:hypothetical protein